MSAIEILRDALYGNPPEPNKRPSREGVLAAFSALVQLVSASGIASTIYPTVAAGMAATTSGQLFLVANYTGAGVFADLYGNDAGTPVAQGVSLPSSAFVGELRDDLDALELGVDAVTATAAQNIIAPVDERAALTIAGSASNGAVFNALTGQVTIPAGQTGALSFAISFIDLQREMLRAGETVVLELLLTTSADLLTALDGQYVPQINAVVTVDGVATEQYGQGANVTITQTGPNEVRLTGEYVIKGGESERAGLYLQIGPASPVTGAARFFSHKEASYRLKSDTANTSAVARRYADLALTSGDISDIVTSEGQIFNGATVIDNGMGLSVPTGSRGQTSYRRFIFDAGTISENVGATVRATLLLRTTADFTDQTKLAGDVTVWHGDTPNYAEAQTASVRKINSNLLAMDIYYRPVGNETRIGFYPQITNDSVARTSPGSFTLEQIYFSFEGYSFEGRSPAEQIIRWREDRLLASSGTVRYSETVTVKPDGTGDYTTLAAAFAARGGGTGLFDRILYEVSEGTYTDVGVNVPYFVDVVGRGRRDKVWFKGELPDSAALAAIAATSTFDMNGTARFFNCMITCRNMRYPFHSDALAFGISLNGAVQEIEDCHVQHYGNQGARDYQTSIGGDPNGVWASEHAWGCGTHSGQKIRSLRTEWLSSTSPFYFHTNADFTEPCSVEVEGGKIICTSDTGNAIVVQSLGSGQADRFVLKHVDVRGPMLVAPNPWLSTSPENQRGDRTSEIEIYVEGCDPIPFTSFNGANVLELRSIDTAGSSVAVSGTGATAMFGAQPDYVAGGVGYPGRVRSSFAITGAIAGLSLGARLGNCTTTNKTLDIVFDGTVNRTLVLNQNYTGMTNAQVVSALNTALAGGARIFQELDPYADTNHLHQPEWESVMLNTDDTAILKGMAVAFDGSQYKAQVMYPGDPVTAFAGIALETFVAGQRGRVMIPGGRIHENQGAFSGPVSAGFGDTFGVSSTPGLLVEGASIPLLRCVEVRGGKGIFRLLGKI